MELNSFIENFVELFDETEASEINSETVFKDLEEWDSMIALSLIAMVDEEYEMKIKADEINNANTVKELFDLINLKK